jgi:hypothetical protein
MKLITLLFLFLKSIKIKMNLKLFSKCKLHYIYFIFEITQIFVNT